MFGVGRLYEVVPGKIYAGPRICTLEVVEVPVLRQIAETAPVSFINLMERFEYEGDTRLWGAYKEVEKLSPYPVDIKCFPIQDHNVPTASDMTRILDCIDETLERQRVVYIHCWSGVGRTGTVVGCWLRRRGVENALNKIFDLRAGTRDPKRPSPRRECQIEMVNSWPPR